MIYVIECNREPIDYWSAPDLDAGCQKLQSSSPKIKNKVIHERITVYELVHALGFDDDIDAQADGYDWLAELYRKDPDTMLYRSEFIANGAYIEHPLDKKEIFEKALAYCDARPKVFYSEDDLLNSYQTGELKNWLDQDQINNLMLQVKSTTH